MLLTPDRRFLLAVDSGDNSVSSFGVGRGLNLLDVKRTGNIVTGMTGTAKSLAYSPSSGPLHASGPGHIRLVSVDGDWMLTARDGYSAVPPDKPGGATTLTPDDRFLLVGSSLDELPATNPDGSPILWVQRKASRARSLAMHPTRTANAVFPVDEHGARREPMFQPAGASSPWCMLSLNHRPTSS